MADNEEWLALVREDALDAERPICDPHHHLWDRRDNEVERRYLLDELLGDLNSSGHNIVSTVFIEHLAMYRADGPAEMKYVGEVEFVNGIAAMAASGLYGKARVAAGIIGHADLAAGPSVGRVLDAEMAAAPQRFRGVRYVAAWDPDPRLSRVQKSGLYLDPTFRAGFAELARRGLLFELVSRFHQLPECADLARAFPNTTIVLNHLGGITGIHAYKGLREEVFAAWRSGIAELAACPNVMAKIGGLGMEYCGFGWHERAQPPTSLEVCEATRRYYETTIELFGPDRCMFESNFPVDKLSYSYGVMWNAFKRMTAGYSATEKANLFHDTASRVYRL